MFLLVHILSVDLQNVMPFPEPTLLSCAPRFHSVHAVTLYVAPPLHVEAEPLALLPRQPAQLEGDIWL